MTSLPQPFTRKLTDTRVIHCRIPVADYEFLQTLCPLHGCMQLIVATTITSLTKTLKENGITTYNPDALIDHLRRLTNSSTLGPEPIADEPTGPNSLRPTDSTTPCSSDNGIGAKQGVGVFNQNFPVKIKILGGASETRGSKLG